MKKNILFAIFSINLLFTSCDSRNLKINPKDVISIKIGKGYNGKNILIKEITDRSGINNFINSFSFKNEKNIGAKHIFMNYVEIFSSTKKLIYFRYENKLIRLNGKEYELTDKSKDMLINCINKK